MMTRAAIKLPSRDALARVAPHTFGRWASKGRYQLYPHVCHTGRLIASAVAEGNGRLIVCWPPGHGKSSLISHWTPTWFLDQWPHRRAIVTSHGAELASHWGRTVRNEFESNPHLMTRLRQDSKAADRWNTPEGGGLKAAGVGGGITGFRADLILVDDPHPTWKAAQSPTERRNVAEWFFGTLTDRAEPGATIILLMHRWHEDDLAGVLVSRHAERWKVIRLPALAGPGDPLGRAEGEALCPERYDAASLLETRADVGELVWSAKYQQDPQAVGSGRAYRSYVPADNDDTKLRLRFDLPVHLSWDFNVNPGVHCVIGQCDFRADLLTDVHEAHGPRAKTRDVMAIATRIIEQYGGWKKFPEVHVFGDRSGKTETTTSTVTDYQIILEELARCGVTARLRVQTANPPIRTRLTAVNEAMCDHRGNVHYRVNPINCPRLVKDYKGVKEDEDGLIDKSDQDLTHPSDAAGYRIAYLRPPVEHKPTAGAPSSVPQPA